MKKIVCFTTVAVLVLFVLTACGSADCSMEIIGDAESYSYATDGAANTSQGIYIGDDQLIHYYDIAEGQETILCSKPDCKHVPYDEDNNPDPTCEASLDKTLLMFCYPILADEFVYLVGTENLSEGVLYRQKLDGSERKKVGSFPYTVQQGARCYVKNHIAYITASIPIVQKDKLGGAGSNSSHGVLIALDLNTADCKVLSEEKDYEWQNLSLIGLEDDKLYYEFSYAKKQKKLEDYQTAKNYNTVYCYNISNSESKEIYSSAGNPEYETLGIYNGKLCMYQKKANAVFVYDESARKMNEIYKAQSGEVSFVATSKYLFILSKNKNSIFVDNKKIELKQQGPICNCFGKWIVTWETAGTDNARERIVTLESFLKREGGEGV